jgi:hypothetical protein
MTDLTLQNLERLGIGLLPVRDENTNEITGWITHHPKFGWWSQERTVKQAVDAAVQVLAAEFWAENKQAKN